MESKATLEALKAVRFHAGVPDTEMTPAPVKLNCSRGVAKKKVVGDVSIRHRGLPANRLDPDTGNVAEPMKFWLQITLDAPADTAENVTPNDAR